MAIKIYCDNCQQENNNRDFSFEAMVKEIKVSLIAGNTQPQLFQRVMHLCKKCYEIKFNK